MKGSPNEEVRKTIDELLNEKIDATLGEAGDPSRRREAVARYFRAKDWLGSFDAKPAGDRKPRGATAKGPKGATA